jgi:4-hydroxy-tetrahydrodipicolinate synthase
MHNLRRLGGIVPALSTAMKKDGSVDEEGIRALVRFNIEKGVHAFAVTIIAGEFYKLTDEERKRVYDVVIDETNGKIPVLAGTSHSGTEPAIELSRYAKDAGADGLIVMPPFFGRVESSLYLHQHYSRIASAVDLPLMIQDAEDYTGVVFSAVALSHLAREYSNIFMVKVEGARTLEKIREIKELTDSKLVILGGMAAKLLLEELELGAQGNIPDGCLPELLVDVYQRYKRADLSGAKRVFEKYRRWLDYLSLHPLLEVAMEKETLRLRGIINSSYVRGPTLTLEKHHAKALTAILQEIGALSTR